MTLEYTEQNTGGPNTITTECPMCGVDLGRMQSLASHLRYRCEENDD